ncbi:thioesterase [Actinosynnema sp. NPDC020468]|uniref:thioesterase n=1 Tax=Actinosynnema sp. NPDC020468 TaxID=3154488 RepID=UPI0034100DD4
MTTSLARPRYDGANIRTWVGFRQFLALAEEAVLGWFRERGLGPHRLYHDHGAELSVVDVSARLPAVLEVDDEVRAEAEPLGGGRFRVTLTAERASGRAVVLVGKVAVALVGGDGVPEVARQAAGGYPPAPEPLADDSGFAWTWRARYFHCHFSDRVQHAAYVRALEEVVDRYLADRGRSVGTLLRDRGWIPVVSRVRVRLLADAHMEEDVRTGFAVTDVLKNVVWEGRMDCTVERAGVVVPVATATIQHGYALTRGPGAGTLARLDEATAAALTGGAA